MLRSSLLFLIFSVWTLSSQAHEVNFQQLKNCFQWTNLGLRSSEAQGFRTSQYLGNLSHGRSANADINALVLRLTNPNRIAVLQEGGGNIYPLSAENQIRSECSRNQDRGGLVLPVRGFLNAGDESQDLNTYIRVQVHEHRGRQVGTEVCPIGSASARMTPSGVRGQEVSDDQFEALVRQAVLERLQWVAQNANPQNTQGVRRNFEAALKNGGACFQVLPMFRGLDAARNNVMCAVGIQQGAVCANPGDPGQRDDNPGNGTVPETNP